MDSGEVSIRRDPVSRDCRTAFSISRRLSTDHAAAHPIFWFLEGITTGTWQFRNFAFIFWSGFVGLFKGSDGENPWVIQLSNLAFAIVAIFFTGIVFGSVVRSIGKKFGSLREGRADCRDRPHRDHRLVAVGVPNSHGVGDRE